MAIINGTTGPDELVGTILADTIDGREGDDTIDGGAGADDLRGGEGGDRILLSSGNDRVAAGGDQGDVLDTANASSLAVDLGAGLARFFISNEEESGTFDFSIRGIPNIDASEALDPALLSGNRFTNRIEGGQGDDVIDGRGGNDVLFGNAGADRFITEGGVDRIDGGSGADILDYSTQAGAVSMSEGRFFDGLNYAQIQAANEPAAADYVRGVERITGSAFGDRLFTAPGLEVGEGNTSTGILAGGGGNDFLIGFTRAVLDGGAGNDVLSTGDGVYRLTGGADTDVFSVAFAGNQNESETTVLDFEQGQDRLQFQARGRGLEASFDFFDSNLDEVLDERDQNVDVQNVFVAGQKARAVVLNEFTEENGSELNTQLQVLGVSELTAEDFIFPR